MKRVLITGATGFVGFRVLRELYNKGIDIIAMVRSDSKNIEKLQGYKVKIIECNLDSIAFLTERLYGEKIDTIYHFAWQGVYGQDIENEKVQLMNICATLELIDVAYKLGISTFIGAGSIHEMEAIYEMSEDNVIKNRGLMYKTAKLAAHYMGKAKAGNKGIHFFWPIITNAYGIGEISSRLINFSIRRLLQGESFELSKGDQLYDFIYVDDVARAFYLVGKKGIDGRNYIIGSGQPQTLYKYLIKVEKYVNEISSLQKYIHFEFGKASNHVVYLSEKDFDIRALEEDTGFSPQVSFDEGIERTIHWIKENEFGI